MTAIYMLWLRQVKRYLRSRSRIVASLGQPLLFLLAFGFGFGPIFQKAGQGNYIQFLAPGVIAMTVLFTSIFSGIELIWDRQFGFLKETLVAPVPRILIMIGRTLGGATVSLMQGMIVVLICVAAGFRPVNLSGLPTAFLFLALIAVMFTALGTAIASVLSDFQGFQLIMNFLVMPIFFLSGALFPLNGLPGALNVLATIDPLSYGVDGAAHRVDRSGAFRRADRPRSAFGPVRRRSRARDLSVFQNSALTHKRLMPRTRSAEAHEKVLDAALSVIAERGIDGASMDAIAQLSGVSKATVYKHWAGKEALCLDAIARLQGELPEFDTGQPRADLTNLLRHLARSRKTEMWGKIWPRLIGDAAGHQEFAKALQIRSTGPRRAQLARLLKQAGSKGGLRNGIDVDFAMDLLFGPILHCRLRGAPVAEDAPERIVELFWKAYAAPVKLLK